MATREASLKVTLQTGSFASALRSMSNMARSTGRAMGQFMAEPMRQGFESAKDSIKGLRNSINDTAKTAATLGGALSVGAMVKSAMEGQQAYTELAVQLGKVEGHSISVATAQGMVESAARRTRIEVGHLNEVAGEIKDVGIEQFEDALVRSQMQAKRLGLEGGMVANIYKTLMTKGLADSAEEAETLMERIANIDDDKLNPDIIREFATQMGVAGGRADRMVNVIEAIPGGVKDFKAASEIVKQFGQSFGSAKGVADLGKAAGGVKVKFDASKTAFENFTATLGAGGAKNQKVITSFMKSFGNEKAQKMLETLLGRELVISIAEGKASKLQMAEAAEKLNQLYSQQYDSEADRVRVTQANNELLNTSEAKFNAALNRLHEAFRSEKMVTAIGSLADKLPQLAEGIASLLGYVVENPGMSLAAVVIGKVGLAFGSSALEAALTAGAKGLFARMAAVQAASAGTSAVAGAAGAGGAATGVGGAVAGAGGGGAALAAGATVAAGVAGAALIGAGAGYAVYKGALEEDQEGEWGALREGKETAKKAKGAKTEEEMTAALQRVREAKQNMAQRHSSMNTLGSMLAQPFMEAGTANISNMRKHTGGALDAEEKRLTEQLAKLRRNFEITADALGGSPTSRGPLRPADPQPGARPVGG